MKKTALAVMLATAFAAEARTPLTMATRDFYVAQNGDDANDCRLATPCATIQRAVTNIKQNYDTNCIQPWVHLFPGTYANAEDYGQQVGCQPPGGGPLVIAGTMGNAGSECVDPALVHITSAPGVNAISLDGNAGLVLICVTVSAPGAAAIYATNGAKIEIGLINFGTANAQIFADAGGAIFATSTLNFMQGANFGIWANADGRVHVVPNIGISFAAGIGYAQFLRASNGGKVFFPAQSLGISGNPSGQKCYAELYGLVNTGNALSTIPGTTPCTTDQYFPGMVY